MPIATVKTTNKREFWMSQTDFPVAYGWMEGTFCCLHEDGSIEFDVEQGFTMSYQGLRRLVRMAGEFQEARRRNR